VQKVGDRAHNLNRGTHYKQRPVQLGQSLLHWVCLSKRDYPTVSSGRQREVFDSCWIWLSDNRPACIPGIHDLVTEEQCDCSSLGFLKLWDVVVA
jgi:hypothetical protein